MGRHKGKNREIWWVNPRGWIEGKIYRDGVCRQVKQHRWIMEQHLRRQLSPKEIIHHINGNRLDNRIENLEIKTNGQHTTYHQRQRTHKKGYRLNLTEAEHRRRADWMKEVHERRQANDPTNKWYARPQLQQGKFC